MAHQDEANPSFLFDETSAEFSMSDAVTHDDSSVIPTEPTSFEDLVTLQVQAIHKGKCPECKGPGPVDVHTSHWIWSFLVLTISKSDPKLCCQSCGKRAKILGLLTSSLIGWWGIPWGILKTPVQIAKNLNGIFNGPDPGRPSLELKYMVRSHIQSLIESSSANWPEIAT